MGTWLRLRLLLHILHPSCKRNTSMSVTSTWRPTPDRKNHPIMGPIGWAFVPSCCDGVSDFGTGLHQKHTGNFGVRLLHRGRQVNAGNHNDLPAHFESVHTPQIVSRPRLPSTA